MKEVFKKALCIVQKPFRAFKGLKKPLKIALCAVLVAAIGACGAVVVSKKKKSKGDDADSSTSVVMRGSVVSSITGSGTVEPIESRDIVPQVNGKITYAPFNEGDDVQEGDVLYMFESTSAENTVEKAKTSVSNKNSNISKVKENISNLTVRATASGKVSALNINIGQEISGAVCKITNYKKQSVTIPFPNDEVYKIKAGDDVSIAVDKYMINTTGTVARKYSSSETLSGGAVVCNVEITLTGTDILEENTKVTATVHTSAGDVASASYGSVEYESPVTVNAEQKGKVAKINVKNGDWVNKGDVIATLTNSDLSEELRTANQSYSEAQMSLSDAQSALEKYMVTAPISGVVLTKDYSVGDTVSGQNSTTMMVIADLSKMKFTISVDELDIAKIEIGQSVDVTADALEGEAIAGTITSLSKMGTSSNGVTTYPVEVTIDDPGELIPGMNVSAEIIVARADDALYLPVSAVEYFGGKYYVTVVGELENMPANERGENDSSRRPNGERGEMPDGEEHSDIRKDENGEMPQGENKSGEIPQGEKRGNAPMPDGENGERGEKTEQRNAEENGGEKRARTAAPEIKLSGKEERVEVTVGISNDDYYEITSGVSLGQVVKNTTQTTGSSSGTMPGMGGGMPGGMGGGMPGGMGGGGMPGGGMGGGRMGGR